VDEIIHLGDYWDEEGITRYKAAILQQNQEIGRLFRRAYGYLAQAQILKDELESYYTDSNAVDLAGFQTACRTLVDEIFARAGDQGQTPYLRHLFASAITPRGLINYFNSLFDNPGRRIIVTGEPKELRTRFIQRVIDRASILGYDAEVFHCALTPRLPEHVIIPALDLVVVSSAGPHIYDARPGDTVLHVGEFIFETRLNQFKEDWQLAKEGFDAALLRAISFLARAKAAHDRLETFYVPNMDFEAINNLRNKTLTRILGYLKDCEV